MDKFQGFVCDLDVNAVQAWCQVILRKEGEQLVAVTTDQRMQSLLELAFATRKYADVAYEAGDPNILTRVKVNVEYPPGK